jgi:hypothetical protein
MHSAIDDWRGNIHQVAMRTPHLSLALLIQIHSHYQRFAKRLRYFDKTAPGWMMMQYVTHHQFTPQIPRRGDYVFCICDIRGEWFLQKHVRTRLHRFYREFRVRFSVCAYRYGVG